MKKIWNDYVWGKQSCTQLAEKYKRSERWIRKHLDLMPSKKTELSGKGIILVADVVFIRRTFGILVGRDYHGQKNIYWRPIQYETAGAYREARRFLESQGYVISGVVLDGKKGVHRVFQDIPVQFCQFHQVAAIRRYLTSRPKLPAGKELRIIALSLTKINREKLLTDLEEWYERWQEFLKEKTSNPETGRWFYTHRRIRSAYRSLKTNVDKLFTYQNHPELEMPNTTNSLDGGVFSHLKDLLRLHRGLKMDRKMKLILEILLK